MKKNERLPLNQPLLEVETSYTVREELKETGETSSFSQRIIIFLCYVLFVLIFPFFIKIIQQYERAVIFRLGKVQKVPKGPGLIFLLPFVDEMRKIDLRIFTMDIPKQTIVTKDSVTVQVNAIVYFRVSNPKKAVLNIEDFSNSTYLLASTTLRSILGNSELDTLLSNREEVNGYLQKQLDRETEYWGISIKSVEIRDIVLPPSMQRVMASSAEAEREKKAKVISSLGEFQAAQRLAEAAKVLSSQKGTMELRYLRALNEISSGKDSTINFPLPIDLLSALQLTGEEEEDEDSEDSDSEGENEKKLLIDVE